MQKRGSPQRMFTRRTYCTIDTISIDSNHIHDFIIIVHNNNNMEQLGLEWLLKMWNPTTQVLAVQVGVGDGGKISTRTQLNDTRISRSL